MVGIAALPQDEAVMVLDGENYHFHTSCFHGLAPLVSVERFQIENCRVFHTITPFLSGKGVRSKVDKSDKLVSQSIQLILCRNYMGCFLDNDFFGVSLFYFDGASRG